MNDKALFQASGLKEVIFEFHRVGGSVRVAAIDPTTNTEVVIVGAPGYGEEALKRLAARKLARAIARRRRGGEIQGSSGQL